MSKRSPQPVPIAQYWIAQENRGDPGHAVCTYCGTRYSIGSPIANGGLLYYPQAERANWRHCLIEDHQKVMRLMTRHQKALMLELPAAMVIGKRYARDRMDPIMARLRTLLAP